MREHKALALLLLLATMTLVSFSNISQMTASPQMYTGASVTGRETNGATNSAAQLAGSQASSQIGNGSTRNILYLSNLTTIDSSAVCIAELADVDKLKSTIGYISSFDNRYTGSAGSLESVAFIYDFFKVNCSITNTFFDNFTFNDQGTESTASNIIAKIDASVPTKRALLITAHHDTIGFQYPFTVYSNGTRGADDDASGVGALLETARVLSAFKEYLKCNILFIAFAAEEGNKTLNSSFMRQGSTHWVTTTHMGVANLGDVIAAVNLDEVAYVYGGSVGLYYHSGGANVASNISSAASMLNIPTNDKQGPRTDSYTKPIRCRTEDTFQNSGIPAVTLSTQFTNPYAHTTQDTLLKLDYDTASTFTKVTLCYASLVAGVILKGGESYARDWNSVLLSKGQFSVNEVNYVIASINPNVIDGSDLVIFDPSACGITSDRLLPIITACDGDDRKTPILALGNSGHALLRVLNAEELQFTVRNTSHNDLVAHVESGIGGISHHPVFNSPNNITLFYEDPTHLNYTILKRQSDSSTSTTCYFVRTNTQNDSAFLSLSYTPLLSESWSWLGILRDQSSSVCIVGFIGVDNSSTLTDAAKNIAENMAWLLLGGSRTVAAIELSKKNPLVGDRINVAVGIRNSLTWKGNSSLLADLEVISPSGSLLSREAHFTDGNGLAQFSQMLLTEVGEHHVTVNITHGAENVTRITCAFEVSYRVEMIDEITEIHVTQGEQVLLELNLTYVPASPENVTLRLVGEPFPSDISVRKTMRHGYNNVTLRIAINETAPIGEYNVSLLIMPATMEYTASFYNMSLFVTPAYDVSIVEAPSTIPQGSTSQLIVRVSSHRSTEAVATLSIDSRPLILRGEATTTILAGETKQVPLAVEETSTSPYQWGGGKIKIVLLRNGLTVVESSSFAVFVSPSFTSVVLGYILPAMIPLPILVERSRRMKARVAATGMIIGGSLFFSIGLVMCQSLFMIVPLTMLIVGCYVGAATMRYIYEVPLPKGYNWILPSGATRRTHDLNISDNSADSTQTISIPEYAFTGLGKLRELYGRGRYWDTIPAGYALAIDILEDVLIAGISTASRNYSHHNYQITEGEGDGTLQVLLKKMEQQGAKSRPLTRLKNLEKLYNRYTELSRMRSKGDSHESSVRDLARSTINLIAEFLDQSGQQNRNPGELIEPQKGGCSLNRSLER